MAFANIETIDFDDHVVIAQADASAPSGAIQVAVDNTAKTAYLRFSSHEAVDTVNAVYFVSKTGNKVANDFGDILDPWSPRLSVQNFLRATSEKQGDVPLDNTVPEHTHPEYQDEITRLDGRCDTLQDEIDGVDGDLAREATSRSDADQALQDQIDQINDADTFDATSIEEEVAANAASIVELTDTVNDIDDQVAQNTLDIDDILNYLQASEVEINLGEAKWMYSANDGEYPSSEHCWSDTPDLTTVNLFMFSRTAQGAASVNWESARAGDTLDVKLDYAEAANHGSYTITQFDVVDGSGEVKPLGSYYRIYVEPREGATNAGKLESGQFARSKILHYEKRFDFTPSARP